MPAILLSWENMTRWLFNCSVSVAMCGFSLLLTVFVAYPVFWLDNDDSVPRVFQLFLVPGVLVSMFATNVVNTTFVAVFAFGVGMFGFYGLIGAALDFARYWERSVSHKKDARNSRS